MIPHERSRALSSSGLRAVLTSSWSKMRAARPDLGCAAPESAMSSRHHGEARCDGRTRLSARCRRRCTWRRIVGPPTPACRRQRQRRPIAARHAGPRRFKSQPRYYPMGRAPRSAPFLVSFDMPNCDNYRAIPLMPRASDDMGAPLRPPAEAPRASQPQI
jgi:hypothetical protein